jgi:18S rRNA (guanine1575-N7)-methyltransferase
MSRPEETGPADLYYNATEAQKYTSNSRIIGIQAQMAERCVELLRIEDGFILDIGAGSGLSGEVLTESGFEWVGVDVSKSMLDVAKAR